MNDKFTALSFIDGIIGSLAREGPGGGVKVSRRVVANTPREWRDRFFDLSPANFGELIGRSAHDALYLARALLEVIYDSVPKFYQLPLESQFSAYFVARDWLPVYFVSLAKWVTVYPLARFLHQILPKVPEYWKADENHPEGGILGPYPGNPLLFTGPCKRLLKNRLNSFNKNNLRLWNSYLQGVKRGCRVVSASFITQAMEKHRVKMVSPDPMSDLFEDRFQDYCLRLIADRPKRTKKSGWREGGIPFHSRRPKLYEASTGATFQISRGLGGGREQIRVPDYWRLWPHGRDYGLLKTAEIMPGFVEYLKGTVAPSFKVAVKQALCENLQSPLVLPERRGVWSMVHPVLEPLKVRLITKGPAYCQWVSRFFQKSMWDYLQLFPQFALTGRPMDPSDLSGILQREKTIIRKSSWATDLLLWSMDEPQWVSGDFSAATDSQSQRATKSILETLLLNCHFEKGVKKVLRLTVYEQNIAYPEKDFNGFPTGLHECRQTNGQLMGSVLSFPILCLANLICYWMAFEERFSCRVNARDLPVLVNGDDILFRADSWLYEIWQSKIKEVGFELSLGKNYVHKDVLVINSEMFLFNSQNESFKRIPFFNTGLLTGQSKLTGRDEVRMMPLPAVFNEVVPDARDQARAFRRFMHYHKDQIDAWTNHGNFNLFLPVWRGGLGMRIPDGHKFSITSFQRRLATLIQEKREECIKEGRLPKGLAVGVVRKTESKSLKFNHKYDLVDVPYGPLPRNLVEIRPTDVSIPLLAEPYPRDYEETLKIPKHRNLRVEPCRRMGTESLMQPEPRMAERIIPGAFNVYDSYRVNGELVSEEFFRDLVLARDFRPQNQRLEVDGKRIYLNRDISQVQCDLRDVYGW